MHLQPGNISQHGSIVRIDAFALADERGILARPGSVLLQITNAQTQNAADTTIGGFLKLHTSAWPYKVLALGSPSQIAAHEAHQVIEQGRGSVLTLDKSVLIPGLVNAHTHLDLTHIGPRQHDFHDGFMSWIDMIRRLRHVDPARIAQSVAQGAQLAKSAGVVLVGDIAGAPLGRSSLTPARAMRDAGINGISFLEFFGIGNRLWGFKSWLSSTLAQGLQEGFGEDAIASGGVGLGISPHATNTVDARACAWACDLAQELGLGVMMHVAETLEEREFVELGHGPQRILLEKLGIFDEAGVRAGGIGAGKHPLELALSSLQRTKQAIAVHVNDARESDVQRLAQAGVGVVYCPRASAYFGAPQRLGAHRYQEMLQYGVKVALGTDSIVNLPADAARPAGEYGGRGISVFDEGRLLVKRDGLSARTALAMMTTHGAGLLGFDVDAFIFKPGGHLAGLAAVELDERWSNCADELEAAFSSAQPSVAVEIKRT